MSIDADTRPLSSPARGGRQQLLILLAASGIVVYAAAALAADTGQLVQALRELGWAGMGLVLALSCINYLLRFQRWHFYLAALGHRLPPARHLLYYLAGFAFTVSPAKAGEAVRALYLREHGVSYTDSIAALFAERLLDFMAMILLAALIVFSSPQYRPLLLGALATILAALLLVGRPFLAQAIERRAPRNGTRLSAALDGAVRLLRSSHRLLQPRFLLSGLVAGLLAWGAEGWGFQLICRGLELDTTGAAAIGIYAIAVLAGGVAFFLPGGVGGMEAVMTGLLVSRHAPLSTAVIATLLCRLATLWFAVLLGLAATALLGFRSGRARQGLS